MKEIGGKISKNVFLIWILGSLKYKSKKSVWLGEEDCDAFAEVNERRRFLDLKKDRT